MKLYLSYSTEYRVLRLPLFLLILIFLGQSFSPVLGQLPDDEPALFDNRDSRKSDDPPPARERLFFGGNFGLQFGSITDIQVSPIVGFWVLPRLAVAAGPDYRFFKYYTEKTHLWGGKSYVELTVLRNINSVIPIGANTDIIFHLEDALLSLETSFFDAPYASDRFYVNTVLAGGGLSQLLGRRAALNIVALWALNESEYGLYSSPEIRLTFIF